MHLLLNAALQLLSSCQCSPLSPSGRTPRAGGLSEQPGGDRWLPQGQGTAPLLGGTFLHKTLCQNTLMPCARLSGSILAIAQTASHRGVRRNSIFIKYKQNAPGQHKILPFFLYWHSQEQLMLSLDRADDSAAVHRLSSISYCGCKSFGRFLCFVFGRWQCP